MPMTITITIEIDGIDDYLSVSSALANIPGIEDVHIHGRVSDHYGDTPQDQTPPHGIERPYWAPMSDTDDRTEAFAKAAEAAQANEREITTSAVFLALRDLAHHITDQDEFLSVVRELGRDAWGSTCGSVL